MKNNKGFTILELLIAIFISIILMSAIYYTYTTFFMGIKSERVNVEQEIEKIVSLELLRLDLEHLGYGVGINCSGTDYRIYEINNNDISNLLKIRSTLNNSNNSTIGWKICKNGNEIKKEMEKSNNNIVYVDENGCVIGTVNDGSCPSGTSVYIGYPYDTGATGCGGFCTEIVYYLSNTNLPKNCHPDTYNLLRKVNNGTGKPLLSCIADMKITVDMDTDGDGKIDLKDIDDVSSYTADQLRAYTKKINVYVLYQEATPSDPNFRFTNYQTDSNGNYLEVDGVKLYLPSNFEKYKWKAIKLSVKPMSIIR